MENLLFLLKSSSTTTYWRSSFISERVQLQLVILTLIKVLMSQQNLHNSSPDQTFWWIFNSFCFGVGKFFQKSLIGIFNHLFRSSECLAKVFFLLKHMINNKLRIMYFLNTLNYLIIGNSSHIACCGRNSVINTLSATIG